MIIPRDVDFGTKVSHQIISKIISKSFKGYEFEDTEVDFEIGKGAYIRTFELSLNDAMEYFSSIESVAYTVSSLLTNGFIKCIQPTKKLDKYDPKTRELYSVHVFESSAAAELFDISVDSSSKFRKFSRLILNDKILNDKRFFTAKALFENDKYIICSVIAYIRDFGDDVRLKFIVLDLNECDESKLELFKEVYGYEAYEVYENEEANDKRFSMSAVYGYAAQIGQTIGRGFMFRYNLLDNLKYQNQNRQYLIKNRFSEDEIERATTSFIKNVSTEFVDKLCEFNKDVVDSALFVTAANIASHIACPIYFYGGTQFYGFPVFGGLSGIVNCRSQALGLGMAFRDSQEESLYVPEKWMEYFKEYWNNYDQLFHITTV